MADIILLVALVIHYIYFTRRTRAIKRAWRRIRPLLAPRLDDPPPITEGFAPRGLDQPDPRALTRPASAALGQWIARSTGMPPHPLRGMSVTLEVGAQRRRVRLLSLTDDRTENQRLDVLCYERGAVRRFPAANLLRVIDPAGDAFEGRAFLDAILAQRAKPGPSLLALEGVSQGATMLIALAQARGALDEGARGVIVEFAHATARAASYRHGDPLVRSLETHLSRLRPDARLVDEAVEWIARQDDVYQRRLLAHAASLADASTFSPIFAAIETALAMRKPW